MYVQITASSSQDRHKADLHRLNASQMIFDEAIASILGHLWPALQCMQLDLIVFLYFIWLSLYLVY